MNRRDRRLMMERAKKRLLKARAWVVVTFDGGGVPMYSYDVQELQDRADLRHATMHGIANHVENLCSAVFEFGKKVVRENDLNEMVLEAKEKRSADLLKFVGSGVNEHA